MFILRIWRKLKILRRLNQILLAFFAAGFSAFIYKLGLKRHLPLTHQLKGSDGKKANSALPKKLRLAFVKLGPVFVKFGQILSTRSDILPKAYIEELEKLQAKVPPFSFAEAKIILEKNLGRPLEKLYAQFDPTPFASASLGQVYKAKLYSGEIVAVKVQRPKAKEQIKLDTDILLMLANWLDKHVAEAKGLNMIGLVQEFRRWTLNELDYRKEATNCEVFSNFFKDDPYIYGPKVFWDYSGDSVLTLEFVDGISLGDMVSGRKKILVDKKKLAHHIADSFVRQFFEFGYFHADPHPGNIFILKNGHVMFLDFGMVGFLDDRLTGLASGLFLALIQKDVETLVSLLQQIEDHYDDSRERRAINPNGLRKELNQLVLQWSDRGQSGQFTLLMSELLQTAIRNGVNVPTDLSMLGKSIMTLDIIIQQLDGEFKMEEWERPMVEKIMTKKLEGKNIKSSLKTSAFMMEDVIKKLPETAANFVNNMEKGKFGMELNGNQLLEYEKLMNANSKINTYGTLLAGILIASALIYQVKGQPEIFGMSVAQIGMYGSLVLIVMFLWGNLRRGKQYR